MSELAPGLPIATPCAEPRCCAREAVQPRARGRRIHHALYVAAGDLRMLDACVGHRKTFAAWQRFAR